jgi:hypothetical protein
MGYLKFPHLKSISSLGFLSLIFIPQTASAATFSNALLMVQDFLNASIGIIISLAAIIFIWGLISLINSAGDAKKHGEANARMFFGIIVLAVMLGIWGLVNILVYTFDLDMSTVPIPVVEVGEIGGGIGGGTIGENPGDGGLVPCGRGTDFCTACDLYQLVHNLMNFLMYISVPLAGLSIAIGGGFILYGAGFSEGSVSKGKEVIWDAIIGLIIILSSWLIINTIISQLTNPGVFVGPWSAVVC